MKKYLKAVSLFISAAMLLVSISGCSSTEKKLDLITQGKIVMGTNAEFPPFESVEGDGYTGVDVDLMKAIATKLGLEFEIKNMEFDSLSAALTGGSIDIIAAGFTIKPDREAVMDFTDTYYTAKQTLIVKSSSTYKTVADITNKGLKIGVQSGTTGSFEAEELTEKTNIIGYKNGSLAVEALVNGTVDAVIIDNNPAKEYKTQKGDAITLIEDQFAEEEYAMAVKKGNSALLAAINKALADLKADGTFDTIVDKYIK